MKSLSLSSTAELESLVTTAIYASLITARLSPATNPPTVNVTAVAPLRDVYPGSLPTMVSLLTDWEARCGEVVSDIEGEIVRIKENAVKRHVEGKMHQKALDEAIRRRQHVLANSGYDGAGGGVELPGKSSLLGRRRPPMGSNKREADDIEEDDGFWESGEGPEAGSRMDIDEGAGSSRGSTRHPKRVVGRKS